MLGDFKFDLGAPLRELRKWRERRRIESWLADIAHRRRLLSHIEMQGTEYELDVLKEFARKQTELLDKEEENVRLLLASNPD